MTPAYDYSGVTIYAGDALSVLRQMPSESVQCCVSSPPYFGLRRYLSDDDPNKALEIGLEPTWQAHICTLVEVFREVRRVLRKDGTCWINYGDCYASSANGRSAAATKAAGNDDRTFRDKPFSTVGNGMKAKDLMMMPARIAIALQEDGWYLRQDVIWYKPNAMPDSAEDRPGVAHEHVFLLSRSARYYYDGEAIKEACIDGDGRPPRGSRGVLGQQNNGLRKQDAPDRNAYEPRLTRNSRSMWEINTSATAEAHFATFPTELVRRCLLAGTSEKGCCPACGAGCGRVVHKTPILLQKDLGRANIGDGFDHGWEGIPRVSLRTETLGWKPGCKCDAGEPVPSVVLDPFFGSGTVGLVAKHFNRRAIGIELNPDYIEICKRRLAQGCIEF